MKQIKGFYLITLAAVLLCFGGLFVIGASAADQNPCSKDIARFCPKIKPGPAGMMALMECLEKHEKELSDTCRDFEAGIGGPRVEKSEEIREKRAFRKNCMGDIVKFCQDTSPTQGRMMKCLNEHESELTAPCSQSMKAMMMK